MAKLTGQAALDWIKQNPDKFDVTMVSSWGRYKPDKVLGYAKSLKTAPTTQAAPAQQYGAQNSIVGDGGIVGNIALGLTSPIRGLAGMSAKLARGAYDVSYKLGQTRDIGRALAESKPIQEQPTDIFGIPTLTQSENITLGQRPLDFGAANALETLAYAVPAGGGKAATVGGRLLTGGARAATASGLSGLGVGLKDPNATPESVMQSGITSAGIGGLFGVGAQGLSEVFKGVRGAVKTPAKATGGIRQIGKEIEAKSVGIEPLQEPKSYSKFTQRVDTIKNGVSKYVDKSGKLTNQTVDDLWNVAGSLREKGLKEIKWGGTTTDDMVTELSKQLRAKVPRLSSQDAATMVRGRLTDIIESRPGSAAAIDRVTGNYKVTPGTLFDLAGDTVEGANIFNNKMTAAMSNREAYAANAVDSVINGFANNVLKKNPSYAEGNKLFTALYQSLPGVRESISSGRVSFTAGGRPGFGSFAQRPAEGYIGRLLQKVPEGPTPTGAVTTPTGRMTAADIIAQQATRVPGRQILQAGVPQVIGQNPQEVIQPEQTLTDLYPDYETLDRYLSGETEQPVMETQAPTVQRMDYTTALEYARQLAPQYGITKASELQSLAKALQEDYNSQISTVAEPATKVTRASAKDIANATSGAKALIKIQSLANSGILAQQYLPDFAKSSEAKQFGVAVREIKDVLMRLRTGATIKKEEADYYEQQIPNVFDDPETINYKLQLFADLFKQVAGE